MRGKALEALKEAMVQYEAKSGRFDETNPWKQNGFKSTYCCEEFDVCAEDKTSGFNRMSSSAWWMVSLMWALKTIMQIT